MRVFNILFETKALDVFTSPFKEFLNKYDSIYSSDMFVIFADKYEFEDHKRKLPVNGVLMFPLKHVVEHPEQYTEYALKSHLYVVTPKGLGLNVKNINLRKLKALSKVIGIDKETFELALASTGEKYKGSDPTMESYLFMKLLTNDVSMKDGEVVYQKISSSEVTDRVRDMGYLYVYQYTEEPSGSVFGKDVTAIGISLTKSISVKESYDLQLNNTEEKDNEDSSESANKAYYTDREYMRRIAGEVAVGLGTTLNKDQPFSMFLDHFFWTVDGIEIKITSAFTSTSAKDTSDGVYYIIDADTPFGLLIKNISANTAIEDISSVVKQIYGTYTTANSDWRPSSRDLFLDGARREYKFFDVQKHDLSTIVNDFYPNLYDFAYRNSIRIPPLGFYNDYEKIYINQFVEFLSSNPTPATQLMKRMEEADHDINDIFFSKLPEKITEEVLNRIALAYETRKGLYPNRNGWHLFKD